MNILNRDFVNRKEKMNFNSSLEIMKKLAKKEQSRPIPVGTQARIDIDNYIKGKIPTHT